MSHPVAAAVGIAVALAAWLFVFRAQWGSIWSRSAITAAVISACSLGVAATQGRLDRVVGPVNPFEVAIGLVIGTVWLAATHVGAAVLRRVMPSFVEHLGNLYGMGGQQQAVAGPLAALLAMAVGEELLFRRLIQWDAGIVVAILIYAGVQSVTRNWPLVVAAAGCACVWGGLAAWRHGILAAVIAHAIWTAVLQFAWPIPTTPLDTPPTRERASA